MPVSLQLSSSALQASAGSNTLVIEFERMPLVNTGVVTWLVNLPITAPFLLHPPFELPVERTQPAPATTADASVSDDVPTLQFLRPWPGVLLQPERAERAERPGPVNRPDPGDLPLRGQRPDLPRSEWVAPTIEQAVDKLMQRLDANDNGSVSLAEFTGGLGPAGRLGPVNAVATRLFNHLDADHDGALTTAEVESMLARLDRDGDGRLGRGEAPPMIGADAVALVGVLLDAHLPGLGG